MGRQDELLAFCSIASGRARLSGFGVHELVGGVAVWLAANLGAHSACRLGGGDLARDLAKRWQG